MLWEFDFLTTNSAVFMTINLAGALSAMKIRYFHNEKSTDSAILMC